MTTRIMNRDLAAGYAESGWFVFPLIVDGKTPALPRNWKEIATNDSLDAAGLWTDENSAVAKSYNIAVRTGTPLLGGFLVVIDVDIKDGKLGFATLSELEGKHGTLPETFKVRTASGGLHLYFISRAPLRNSANKIGHGIDIRGENGYVVGPGSSIAGRIYSIVSPAPFAHLPLAWEEALADRRKPRSATSTKYPLVELDTEPAKARAVDWLKNHAPEAVQGACGDNTTIQVANRVGDFGVSASATLDLMLDYWNYTKASPPWEPDELADKVASAFRSRQNPIGIASAEAEFDAVEITDDKAPPRRRGLDVRNITSFGWSTAQGGYLVQGFLNYKMLAMMSAPSNAGKSPLALDLAAHIALGRPWRGRKVKPAYVLHYSTEGFTGLGNRMEALRREHFSGAANAPFDFLSGSLDLRTSTKDAMAIIETVRERSAVFGVQAGLVVIDTLSHALGGGDDSNQEHVRAVLKNCAKITSDTGAAVMLLHHPTKNASSDYRGSSVMLNDIDLLIKVDVDPKSKRRTVTTPRVKEFAEIDPLQFHIKVVRLGQDEEGDDITSIVVDWVDVAEVEFEPKLTPPQEEVLAAFDKLITERNAAGKRSNSTIATFSEWKESLKLARKVTGKGSGENQTLVRCLPALIENGLVAKTASDQYVRLTP